MSTPPSGRSSSLALDHQAPVQQDRVRPHSPAQAPSQSSQYVTQVG